MKLELKVEKSKSGIWWFAESKELPSGRFGVTLGQIALCDAAGSAFQDKKWGVMVITTKRPHHRRSIMVEKVGDGLAINGQWIVLGASQLNIFHYLQDFTSKAWIYIK